MEQPLPPHGACLLGSFNLVKYIYPSYNTDEAAYKLDIEDLIKDIYPIVAMMDNVIDNTIYPLKEQEAEAKSKRRMGLGITGLANTCEILGYKYG